MVTSGVWDAAGTPVGAGSDDADGADELPEDCDGTMVLETDPLHAVRMMTRPKPAAASRARLIVESPGIECSSMGQAMRTEQRLAWRAGRRHEDAPMLGVLRDPPR
jgi:hypothetical protein